MSPAQGIRVRLVLIVGLVAAALSWIVLRLAGGGVPAPSWVGLAVFVVIGAGLLAAGLQVRRLVQGTAKSPVSPLYAARVLALAQAAALAGAAVCGWYLASVVVVLPDIDVESQRSLAVQLAVLAVAAAAVSGIGLLVQSWCRIDDDDRPEPGGNLGATA